MSNRLTAVKDTEWRESDHLGYTLAILRNRLDLERHEMRSIAKFIQDQRAEGIDWSAIKDEARMALSLREFRTRLAPEHAYVAPALYGHPDDYRFSQTIALAEKIANWDRDVRCECSHCSWHAEVLNEATELIRTLEKMTRD